MPWVDMMVVDTDQKSSNWIAQETGFNGANGKKWMRNWKLEEIFMCHCFFRNLMTSAIELKKKRYFDFKTLLNNFKFLNNK